MIKMRIGSKNVEVDGVELQMDTKPFLKDSRTFVPVRFVAEGMGLNVEWNNDTQMSPDRLGLDLSSATKFITSLSKIFNGAWAEYRQALRDLPTQAGFPFNVEFPKPPDSEDDSENELT